MSEVLIFHCSKCVQSLLHCVFPAQNRDLNVTMTQKCSDPVTFKFGKCDIAYYRQENKQNELTLVFDQNGTLFLLNATRIACDNGWNPDGA